MKHVYSNTFYFWLVGFIALFWAADLAFIGLWTGGCIGWALMSSAKIAQEQRDSGYQSTGFGSIPGRWLTDKEKEELKVFLNGTKTNVPPFYNYERKIMDHVKDKKDDIWFRQRERGLGFVDVDAFDKNRLLYGSRLFDSARFDKERSYRLLNAKNMTEKELRDLKENFLIPNHFSEEEKELLLYPSWRNRENFFVSEIIGGTIAINERKEYPPQFHHPNGLIWRNKVILDEAFAAENGYHLYD